MDTMMKALSVTRTWAWLLVHGHKDVENRTWYTNHRGVLLIHASNTSDRDDWEWLHGQGWPVPDYDLIPYGCIVGQVTVTDCTREQTSEWHLPAQYGWYVKNAVAFEHPVAYRGWLQLFNVPLDTVPEARPRQGPTKYIELETKGER